MSLVNIITVEYLSKNTENSSGYLIFVNGMKIFFSEKELARQSHLSIVNGLLKPYILATLIHL